MQRIVSRVFAVMGCLVAACSHDWDALDPQGTGEGTSGGLSTSTSGSTSTGGVGTGGTGVGAGGTGATSSTTTTGPGGGGSRSSECEPPAALDPASNHCYRPLTPPATWDAQRAQCQALGNGWDLAATSTAAERDFVDAMVPYDSGAWIGGRDVMQNEMFVWVNGEAWGGFTTWEVGDPNGGIEDCIQLIRVIDAANDQWRDNPCDEVHPALCERP